MKVKFLSIVFAVAVILFTACEKDHGPSIDDHFLNYDIPHVPVTEDYVVGVDYRFAVTSYGDQRYKELFAKTPVLGEYSNILNEIAGSTALVVDSHLVWLNEAKVDFLILTVRSGSRAFSSFESDMVYVDRILSSPYLGDMKIALSYNFGGLGLGTLIPNQRDSSMIIEYREGALDNYIRDYTEFMAPYFDHPNYMHVEGKSLVFLPNAYRLWSLDNAALTQRLRDELFAQGDDIFLVGEQENWSPPQRFEHRLRGAVDAIYHANYLSIPTNDLTRLYQFHQVTDQAWQYSKEMFNEWEVQYIPNIGPSRNSNLNSGNAISPYYSPYFEKDSTFFVDYCNVGKRNADWNRIVLIESWNEWRYDTQIEPAEEYGKQYLQIIKEQFKR